MGAARRRGKRMETTQEGTAGTPVEQPASETGTKPSALQRQFQEAVGRLGQLTISLVQQREELAEKERQAEALEAEITQRRLRIEADEREMLRAQGAAGALQALVQGEQGANDAN